MNIIKLTKNEILFINIYFYYVTNFQLKMPRSFAACTFNSISKLNDKNINFSTTISDLNQMIKKSKNADDLSKKLNTVKVNGKKLSSTTINSLVSVRYKKYT